MKASQCGVSESIWSREALIGLCKPSIFCRCSEGTGWAPFFSQSGFTSISFIDWKFGQISFGEWLPQLCRFWKSLGHSVLFLETAAALCEWTHIILKMASPSRKNRNYTRRWLWDHWSVFLKSKELHKHWFGEVTRPLAKLWGNPLIYLFHWEMGSYHFACLIKDSPMLLLRNLSHFIWHQGCTIPPWTCRLAEVTNAAEQTLLCLLS